jgi:hypothetical protein
MEFQEAPLVATAPVRRDEGAAVAIVSRHCAPHLGRDVPRIVELPGAAPRVTRDRELSSLEFRDEHDQRAVDDLRDVAAGNRVPEQILRPPQAFPGLGASRETDLVSLGREGTHHGARRHQGP